MIPPSLTPNPIVLFSSKSGPVTEAEITLVNQEDPEDGTLDSRV